MGWPLARSTPTCTTRPLPAASTGAMSGFTDVEHLDLVFETGPSRLDHADAAHDGTGVSHLPPEVVRAMRHHRRKIGPLAPQAHANIPAVKSPVDEREIPRVVNVMAETILRKIVRRDVDSQFMNLQRSHGLTGRIYMNGILSQAEHIT